MRPPPWQIEAIEHALESEAPCGETLNLAASVRGAVTGLTAELIEDHIREHLVDTNGEADAAKAEGAAELMEIVSMYLK